MANLRITLTGFHGSGKEYYGRLIKTLVPEGATVQLVLADGTKEGPDDAHVVIHMVHGDPNQIAETSSVPSRVW